MAIAIKRWIEQGRPSPEVESEDDVEPEVESEDDVIEPPRKVTEPEPKSKPKRKRRLFGLFR